MFGNDATHKHYLRMVHGAIESGWREANRIIRDLSNLSIQSRQKPQKCQIAIVGAGMAGLGAARELMAAGITDVIVLEAQDQAGGRVRSIPLGNEWLELGAQWVHGENNSIYRTAHKHGLLSDVTSVEGLGPYLSKDGSEICSSLVAHVSHKISMILEECEKFAEKNEDFPISIGHYMRDQFEQYLASCTEDSEEEVKLKWQLFHWHRKFQIIDNSCADLDRLSAKDWGKYTFTGGDDCINLLNGYSSVVSVLLQDLPKNIFFFNTPVDKITWSKSGELSVDQKHLISISCADGCTIMADHVIVTSSIGYLKENYKTLFSPSLPPSLSSVIESIGFGAVNKVFLIYDKPWWGEKTKAFQIVQPVLNNAGQKQHRQDPAWWLDDLTGFDVWCHDPPILLAWLGGEGAIHMETLDEDVVAEHCTNMLQRYTQREDIPLPASIIRSKWMSNPYIRGGYSHTTTDCDKMGCGPKDLAKPVFVETTDNQKHPVVLLAGEAAHEFYFSTTHGAFESGQSQARVIIEYLRNSSEAVSNSSIRF